MATRRALKPVETGPDLKETIAGAVQEELHSLLSEDTFSAETLNPALAAIYQEMGYGEGEDGNPTVHVSMLDADVKGNEANIWKGDPDEYDLEALAKKFGSGQYRVRIYMTRPDGQRIHKANKVFVWKLSREDEAKLKAPATTTTVPLEVTVTTAVAEAMKTFLPHMHAPAAAPAQSPMEVMQMAIQMAKVMSPAPQPQVNPMDMMRSMAEMMAIMRPEQNDEPIARGGNAGTNDLILAIINKFGPLFSNALMQNMPPQAQTMSVVPAEQISYQAPAEANNAPAGVTEPATPTEQETDVNFLAMQKLKMGVGFLIGQCKAGGLPETYAEVVLDSVPPETIDQLLKEGDPYAWLLSIVPDVKEHEAWFKALFAECKAIVALPPDET